MKQIYVLGHDRLITLFVNKTCNDKLRCVEQFDGVKSADVPLSILYHRLIAAKNIDEEITIRREIVDLLQV